ncbi:glycosyltransferase [Marinobacterium iners]|uniref:glycosyltransferase n=1 Tax=Marinobacterium iners TaxID=48076 RepID=UPI001A8EBCB1|nr:glycosyltransferase [Marinobacterium iners]
MNVLHLYKSAPPEDIGGVGVVIQNISRYSSVQGVRHRVLVCTKASELRVEQWPCGAEVYFCPQMTTLASMPFSVNYLRQFKQLLDWANILHFHHPFPLQDLLYLSARLRRRMPPAVVTYHSDVVRQRFFNLLYTPLARKFLRSVDTVVATSPNYVQSSMLLKTLDRQVDVIPLGVNPLTYPPVYPQVQARLREQVGEGFCLFLGALRYYKGLSYLINAARETGIPVVIAGRGEMEPQLRHEASGASNIHFITEVSEEEKVALLSLAQIFVFPSHVRSEAFGISLLEAQMMRLPLITCEIETGTSYVNQADVTGLIVPPADSLALAEAMRRLHDDPSLCRKMGFAGYARFLGMFTAQEMASRYLQLYRNMCERQENQ